MQEKGVFQVALTGSLACGKRNAHDIDLVILHAFDEDFKESFCVNPDPDEKYIRGIEKPSLYWWEHVLSERFSPAFAKALEVMSRGAKVDLFFANKQVLYNCDYLRSLNELSEGGDSREHSEDFYKRIFCELPLLPFDCEKAEFSSASIHHNNGLCCFPKRTRKNVLREHGKL